MSSYSENALAKDQAGIVWHHQDGVWTELFPGPGVKAWRVKLDPGDTIIHGERYQTPEEQLVDDVRDIIGDSFLFFEDDIAELLEAVHRYEYDSEH